MTYVSKPLQLKINFVIIRNYMKTAKSNRDSLMLGWMGNQKYVVVGCLTNALNNELKFVLLALAWPEERNVTGHLNVKSYLGTVGIQLPAIQLLETSS